MQKVARLSLFACILFASTMPVHATRPAAGITLDESREVALLAASPPSCISIPLVGATVLLDKAELERLAASKKTSWTTEAERLAFIAANRARGLLAQLSTSTDALGCFALSGPLGAEAGHVVLSALEAGRAGVKNAAGETMPAVRVRYLGDRSAPMRGRGSILVYLPGVDRPFLVVDWWVS